MHARLPHQTQTNSLSGVPALPKEDPERACPGLAAGRASADNNDAENGGALLVSRVACGRDATRRVLRPGHSWSRPPKGRAAGLFLPRGPGTIGGSEQKRGKGRCGVMSLGLV